MFRIPRVSISMRELDRLKCIQGLIDKQLKQKEAFAIIRTKHGIDLGKETVRQLQIAVGLYGSHGSSGRRRLINPD
jgi:hypothetical protein